MSAGETVTVTVRDARYTRSASGNWLGTPLRHGAPDIIVPSRFRHVLDALAASQSDADALRAQLRGLAVVRDDLGRRLEVAERERDAGERTGAASRRRDPTRGRVRGAAQRIGELPPPGDGLPRPARHRSHRPCRARGGARAVTITLDQLGPRARAHVEQQRAEQAARAERERLAALTDADVRRLEKAEQALVVRLFRAFGCTVRSTSQARASKVAPGLPDLLVHHRPTRQFWFWETKRPQGGTLSPDQVDFAEDCEACRVAWYSGSLRDAESVLCDIGIAERGPGLVLEPRR